MPPRINPQPSNCRGPSTSPINRKLNSPANTGSAAKIERGVGARREPLRDGLDEERCRSRQDAGERCGKEHLPRDRRGIVEDERRNGAEYGHGGDLPQREAHGVVAGGEVAEQQDVRRVGDGAAQHEQVAGLQR